MVPAKKDLMDSHCPPPAAHEYAEAKVVRAGPQRLRVDTGGKKERDGAPQCADDQCREPEGGAQQKWMETTTMSEDRDVDGAKSLHIQIIKAAVHKLSDPGAQLEADGYKHQC